jgi:hypothetical protein
VGPAGSVRPSPAPEPSADIDVRLAHRKIQEEPDRAGDGYLSAHKADRLDVHGLLDLLRVRADVLQVRAPSLPAGQVVQRIASRPVPPPPPPGVPAHRPGPAIPPMPPSNPEPSGAFPVHTHNGAAGCLGRLLAIAVLAFFALVGVDMALEEWVGAQGRLADSLASAGVEPQMDLPSLLSQGEPNAVFQVVLACDPTALDCRKTLNWLTAWQEKDAAAPAVPALGPPRLVFLQRVGDDAEALTAGAALQALDEQDLFWSSVPALAKPSQSMHIQALRQLVETVGGKEIRWERDRADPDTQLHVRTDCTMAEALEMPAGVAVLASGQPLEPTSLVSAEALQAALAVSAHALQRAIETHAGDAAAGQLALLQGQKPMVQQRYLHWILRSQRMGPLPPTAP